MNELLKFILGIAESKKKVQKPSPEMENHLLSILVFYHSIERNIYPLLIFFRWFLTCSSCSHKSHGLQYIDESGPDDVYLKNWASTSADKNSLSANVWQREQIWDLLYDFFFFFPKTQAPAEKVSHITHSSEASPSISGICHGWKTGHTWYVSWTHPSSRGGLGARNTALKENWI